MFVSEVIYISLKALDPLIGWYIRSQRFLREYWCNSICLLMSYLDVGHPPPLRSRPTSVCWTTSDDCRHYQLILFTEFIVVQFLLNI